MSDDTKIEINEVVDNYIDTTDALRASTMSLQDLEDRQQNERLYQEESTVDLQDIATLTENESISDLGNTAPQESKKLSPEELKAKMASLAMLVQVEKTKNPPKENLASKPEDMPEEDLDDDLDDEKAAESTASNDTAAPAVVSSTADQSAYKNPNDNIINFANYKAAMKPEGFNVTNPTDDTLEANPDEVAANPDEVAANPNETPADAVAPKPAAPTDAVEAALLRDIEKSEAKRALLLETNRLRDEAKNGAQAAIQQNPELQGTPEEQEKQKAMIGRNPHSGNLQMRTGIDGKALGDATAHLIGNIIKSPITGTIAATAGVKKILTDRAIVAETKNVAANQERLREHQQEKDELEAYQAKTIKRHEEKIERIAKATALREAMASAKAAESNDTPKNPGQDANTLQPPVSNTSNQTSFDNNQSPIDPLQSTTANDQNQTGPQQASDKATQTAAPVRKRRSKAEMLSDDRNAVSSKNPLHNVNPAMKKSLENCSKSELGFAAAHDELKENGDKMSPDEKVKKEKELSRHYKNYAKNANLTNDMLDKVKGKNDPSNKAAADMLDRMNDKMLKGADEAHDKKFLDKDKLKLKNSKGETISLEDIAKRTKAIVEKIMAAIKKVVGAVASIGKKKP